MWGDILTTVQIGKSTSETVYGLPFYDHLVKEPKVGAPFDRTMAGFVWLKSRAADPLKSP